jgi:hypothetical protein
MLSPGWQKNCVIRMGRGLTQAEAQRWFVHGFVRNLLFVARPVPGGWQGGGLFRRGAARVESSHFSAHGFGSLHALGPASLRNGTLGVWENSPALARRWN